MLFKKIKSLSQQKMRIGILGAGGVSKDLHLPVLVNIPNVDISWICDKDEQRARQLAKLFKIPRVFDNIEKCSDVEIVLVAIPVGYRNKVMHHIFRRGWHAFCEKPFAVTLTECDQYLSEAERRKVQVGVGMVRRYGAATVAAKRMIHEGYFGDIVEVWASEGARLKRTGKEDGWYMADTKAAGGGVLMEVGSHLVDQMCMILDVNDFKLERCIQKKFKGLEFETRFIGSLSTEKQNSIPCVFEVSRIDDLCNGIFVKFPNLILKCGLGFDSPLEVCSLEGKLIAQLVVAEGAKTIAQAFFLEWRDFIDQCISGSPSSVSADTARQSTAIIEECYVRAQTLDIDDMSETARNG
jgi:hypothetical protein